MVNTLGILLDLLLSFLVWYRQFFVQLKHGFKIWTNLSCFVDKKYKNYSSAKDPKSDI